MPLPQDKVFLGMTRPSSFGPFGGTHFGVFIGLVIAIMYVYFFTDNLWVFAAAIPLYAICVAITAYDPHAFRLIRMKIQSFAETFGNFFYWKGGSRSPYGRRRF
jgi:type IV secretory pathway VirB3-like protein